MDRKEFLKNCGFACAGSIAFTSLLQSCSLSKTATGSINETDLLVSLSDFEARTGNEVHYKKYLVVNNDKLKFPVCVYRLDAQTYSALWLQCPHQGTALQVFGDKLQCPAHGSEFDHNGNVSRGPAGNGLRSFPTKIENDYLKISLKAV